MKKYTEHCDLCEKEFDNDKNGFCIEIGYSIGGWGRRQDFTPKRSIEVCNTCLRAIKKKVDELDEAIRSLKKVDVSRY